MDSEKETAYILPESVRRDIIMLIDSGVYPSVIYREIKLLENRIRNLREAGPFNDEVVLAT